jgi:outer membrane protein insertion porin family
VSLGASLGDLPPYDAHPLGGVNCVRGYDEGAMGTARHWGVLNAELERPVYRNRVAGVLFLDAGTDFDSGKTVVGDPAGTRGKPGKGLGYGIGMRATTPIGLLRIDYAWSDRAKWREAGLGGLWSKGKLHIGLGARF